VPTCVDDDDGTMDNEALGAVVFGVIFFGIPALAVQLLLLRWVIRSGVLAALRQHSGASEIRPATDNRRAEPKPVPNDPDAKYY
jgi:hypothetical protein